MAEIPKEKEIRLIRAKWEHDLDNYYP